MAHLQNRAGVEHVRSLMSAPVKKRGKEREVPKAKKPSALRKVRYFGAITKYQTIELIVLTFSTATYDIDMVLLFVVVQCYQSDKKRLPQQHWSTFGLLSCLIHHHQHHHQRISSRRKSCKTSGPLASQRHTDLGWN